MRILAFAIFFSISGCLLHAQTDTLNAHSYDLAARNILKDDPFSMHAVEQFKLSAQQFQLADFPIRASQCLIAASYVFRKNQKHPEEKEILEMALGYLDPNIPEHTSIRIEAMYRLSGCEQSLGQSTPALTHINRAIRLEKGLNPGPSRLLVLMYRSKGDLLLNLQQNYEAADSNLQLALKIEQTRSPTDSILISRILLQMATVYQKKGDLGNAIRLIQQARAIRVTAFGEVHPAVANCYTTLGNIYYEQKKNHLAQEYYQKAAAIFEAQAARYPHRLADIYNNLGLTHVQLGQAETAVRYYVQSLRYKRKHLPSRHLSYSLSHSNMGLAYLKMKDFSQAKKHLLQAVDIANEHVNESPLSLAESLYELAYYYDKHSEPDSAILCYRRAFSLLYPPPLPKGFNEPLGPATSNHPVFLLRGLIACGKVWVSKHRQDGRLHSLQQSLACFEKADSLISSLRQDYHNQYSQLAHSDLAFPCYAAAVGASVRLYQKTQNESYLDQAFYFAERSKSSLLTEGLRQRKQGKYSKALAGILTRTYSIKEEISQTERTLRAMQSSSKNKSKVLPLQKRLGEKSQELQSLSEEMKSKFPRYYALRFNKQLSSLADLQNGLLRPGDLFLEYCVGDSSLFVFALSEKRKSVREIKDWNSLRGKILHLLNGAAAIRIDENWEANARQFQERAFALYQALLAPELEALSAEKPRLIIVPDDLLSRLPFGMLLTQSGSRDYDEMAFLIQSSDIAYGFSGSHLLQLHRDKSPKTAHRCLAMAWSEEASGLQGQSGALRQLRNSGKASLPGTGRELQRIAQVIEGDYYFGQQASKKVFSEKAKNYGILHLALHGYADSLAPQDSKLSFPAGAEDSAQGDFLYSSELYQLSLPAEMVVLSACETGKGAFSKGEGALSLARGFAFAGSKNVVNSLWQLDDQSTGLLMDVFYGNLSQGESKSSALSGAKRQYLSQHSGVEAHPFYWAGLISIGKDKPLDLARPAGSFPWWLLIPILPILVLLLRKYFLKNRLES